uniref:Uncharacterized protein n=1 Tax=Salix viminalis TaxID=40686 RepID=A0A6N2MC79_SALVM
MPIHTASQMDMPMQAANCAILDCLIFIVSPRYLATDFVDTVDFIEATKLINAVDLDTISLCLFNTISRQLSWDESSLEFMAYT